MKDSKLTVAAVQFNSAWESVESNLARASEMVVAASSADLVVLPEMFATGFSMAPEKIAQTTDGVIVTRMKELSRTSGKALIFSAAIVENEKHYNRLFFIKPTGDTATYDKRHTFRMAGEHEHYAHGNERLIVQYKGFRICPLVCYDLRFPVFSRVRGDYDVLIYIAAWPSVRSYPWQTLLRARAIENLAYCVGVNRSGDDPQNHYSGDSAVLDFRGMPLVEAEADKEQTVTAELSLDALRDFRRSFPADLDADNFLIRNWSSRDSAF